MCNFYLLDYFEAKCNKVKESVRRFPVLNQDSEQRLQPYFVSVNDSSEENFGIELQNETDETKMKIPIDEIDWPRLA